MTTYTYGTNVNAAHYVETPDGVSNPPPRPTAAMISAGMHLEVRDLDGNALADQSIEALTGYFNFTVADEPIVQVSADDGSHWTTLRSLEAENAAALLGIAGNNAQTIAEGVRTDLDDFLATIGQPGGIAQLDSNGILVAGQGAGYYPVGQNLDGTYNARPAVPWPILWVMRVPGSSLPDNDGSVLGGGGMIEGLDGTIDLTVTFGS